ncbi:MAG TPA: MBL fold metallo-hydrolase [Planctomycetota bacterium]|nr:MBL fold metallo-hydrolase [Planctomycetota bacterium]
MSLISRIVAFSLAAALIFLSGCDVDARPEGGPEGRTLVYGVFGRQGVPNGGIICTRIGCIVIDPPLSPVLGANVNNLALAKSKVFWDSFHAARHEKAATLQPPVLYVLNTTFRATHTFGNQSFDKADIISTPAAKERMVRDGPSMREELRDLWKIPGLELHYTAAANLTVEGTMNIDTPDIKVQFISMGDCVGDGDAVVYLPGQKLLFAGDLVIPGNVPYYKGRTQTVRNWIEALKKLDKMDIDKIIPGHGEEAGKDAIARQREFLEALLKEVEAGIKAGMTIEQAAQQIKLQPFANWSHYNDWLGENVKLVYRELKGEPMPAGNGGIGAVQPAQAERLDAFKEK